MIKGVLFDMDGLMLDTEAVSLEGWLKAGEYFNYELKPSDISSFRGRTRPECERIFKEKFDNKLDFYDFVNFKSVFMKEYFDKNGVPIKKGLIELLEYLKEKGIKKSVASSTKEETVRNLLNLAGVLDYFDAVVGGDNIKNSKPAPDIYLEAASRLGLSAKECIGLEDSHPGIMSAKAAGCFVIGIPDLDPIDGLALENCDRVLEDLSQVIDVIEKLNN